MNNSLIKIKDVSDKYAITARTLRYYEDMGLIKSIRSDNYAYRSYSEETIKKLEQILILRRLNISVKDIKRIFDTSGSEIILEVLSKKAEDIDEEVALLHELKEIVLKFIRQIKQADFSKDSDVKLLYEQAKEIEVQLVSADNNENIVDLDYLIEVSNKLKKYRVEIGQAELSEKDISNIEIGDVISLDKNANDMIDLFLNEKLVAKGSIVVIEKNFDIRNTEVTEGNFGFRIAEIITDL